MEQPDRKPLASDARLNALVAFNNGQRTGAFDQWLRQRMKDFRSRHEGVVTSPTFQGGNWHY